MTEHNRICISSGHGLYIRGASGSPVPPQCDEVDEARKVVDRVAQMLRDAGITVYTFHDNTSHDQNTNLHTITDWHNSKNRTLDVSTHFNCYDHSAHGVEVLYVTQADLAAEVSRAIADAGGLTNRGAKYRSDLYVLNNTNQPAILIETAFCDNTDDCNKYRANFDNICRAIAETIAGVTIPARPGLPDRPPPDAAPQTGKVSWFGGPEDTGVSPDEGLAFISDVDQKPELFLPDQPPGTSGLARRLNPHVHFLAMRWDYDQHSKTELLTLKAFVRNPRTGFGVVCMPADWGPNSNTGRLVDVSKSVMADLGLETDDEVEVTFPAA